MTDAPTTYAFKRYDGMECGSPDATEAARAFTDHIMEIKSVEAVRRYMDRPDTGKFLDAIRDHDAWIGPRLVSAIWDVANDRLLRGVVELAAAQAKSQPHD